MTEPEFNTRLLTGLRRKLGEHYEIVPEFEPGNLREVQDLAVIEDGRLKMMIDIGADDLEKVKPEMRKFYGEMKDVSDLVLAACNQEELVIFDADHDILNEKYGQETVDQIAGEIAKFLGGE